MARAASTSDFLLAHVRTRAYYEENASGPAWLHLDEPVSKEEWQARFDELERAALTNPLAAWPSWPGRALPAGTPPPNARVQLSEMANGRLALPHDLRRLLFALC